MAIRAIFIDKPSPFLGEECALCKQPFSPGDEVVVCPEDGTRHHVQCWRANGNKCTALGCLGQGEVAEIGRIASVSGQSTQTYVEPDRKVQTLPERSYHCAQSCLILVIALAIILFAIGCFGLWAIADYLMTDVFGWHYREPMLILQPLLTGWLSAFFSDSLLRWAIIPPVFSNPW